ncbi:Calcineurin-like phosphoesterase [Amycolatopsis xylanica]|uniref:Calcineurin-like phosphoesterase n=1 Tax=Amycolatopsis xylanica TaxID=589385 RepID=A0A1H3FXM4_9PSEU|nr:discoidin domain-containing protein [Amycolatopsis xylanica]SDX95716.1 Calcineurin-like phosphoesterase [Amycolatopsis xylanica]
MKRRIKQAAVVAVAGVLLVQPVTVSSAQTRAESLLSAGKPTTTSSAESDGFGGDYAVDSDLTTRWASAEAGGTEWIAVDLGGPAIVSRVKLTWESAYAKGYQIQASADGVKWTDIKAITDGDGGVDEITGLDVATRHIRVNATVKATKYGVSLWELEVYGARTGDGDIQPPSAPAGLKQTAGTANTITLGWEPAQDNVGVTGYEILRGGNVIGKSATNTFTDTSLASGWDFTYAVRARDAAGNLSPTSATVPAKTEDTGSTDGTVIAVSGDIAKAELPSAHSETAKVVERIKPKYVLTVGDNQYDDGTIAEYRAYYDKTWGKFKSITKPVPGNHEWNNKLAGYKQYFGKIATPNGKPYYSYNIGDFHFVALDSDPVYNGGGSDQVSWLRKDLAANSKSCVIGYWHHPRFNSGQDGDQKSVAPLWNEFSKAKADVVFQGHDHHYERTKPLNTAGHVDEANGVRSVIVGIGGDSLYLNFKAREGVEKIFGKHGVMKLVLKGKSYSWEIIGTDGKLLDQAGPYTCR